MFSVDFHSYVTMNHRPNSHIQQKQVCYGKAMNQKKFPNAKRAAIITMLTIALRWDIPKAINLWWI